MKEYTFMPKEASALEDAFFLEQEKKLIQKLKELEKMEQSKESLKKISGIENDHVLAKLVELEIKPETLAALVAIPMIEVAWADGDVDAKEKKVILDAIKQKGILENSVEYELMSNWLEHRPESKMLDAWAHYIKGICHNLDKNDISQMKQELLKNVNAVAAASGGILGVAKISADESKMIKKLEAAFH